MVAFLLFCCIGCDHLFFRFCLSGSVISESRSNFRSGCPRILSFRSLERETDGDFSPPALSSLISEFPFLPLLQFLPVPEKRVWTAVCVFLLSLPQLFLLQYEFSDLSKVQLLFPVSGCFLLISLTPGNPLFLFTAEIFSLSPSRLIFWTVLSLALYSCSCMVIIS